MIVNFRCKQTEALFVRQRAKMLDARLQRVAYRKLLLLDAATSVADLRIPPGNRLERLKGNRVGQYSIRINDQWRIVFTWKSGHAQQVQIVDYHK